MHKIDEARKNASILINSLIEYSQRCDLMALEKTRLKLKYKEAGKEHTAELLICDNEAFLFLKSEIKRLTDRISISNIEEVSKAVEKKKSKQSVELNPKVFELLKKELREYEIIF